MASWILGDVHGCSDELAALLARIGPGPGDSILCCGDLVHRGPDPAGVIDLLAGVRARFVLGNHERAVLRRVGIAPRRLDGADRGPEVLALPPLDARDLAGDGGTPCRAPSERRADVVRFLQRHSGYLLQSTDVANAGPTRDGRPWIVVHAGVDPSKRPADCSIETLTTVRRLGSRGRPWWYEEWRGPELVVFGHTHSALPRIQVSAGRRVAVGLDTGCVYGGALTAYSPELDELVSVPATSHRECGPIAARARA